MAASKVLIVGATGMIGGLASQMLADRGIKVALAGRNPKKLGERARSLGSCPHLPFDAYDLDGCADLAPWAEQALGGLDAVVVAIGVAGFGRAEEVDDASAEHLMTINALAPMAVVRGALSAPEPAGCVVVVTGAIVDSPLRGTADYAASKAALAAWLGVVKREQRQRGVSIVDVRMPHLKGGFADRAVIGIPPAMPQGSDATQAVEQHVIAPVVSAPSRKT